MSAKCVISLIAVAIITVLVMRYLQPVCEECEPATPKTCGEGTILQHTAETDGMGRTVERDECVPAASIVCGEGTYERHIAETDGMGRTVERDECVSVVPTTICGDGTVETDGMGKTVERDRDGETFETPPAVNISCVPDGIPPNNSGSVPANDDSGVPPSDSSGTPPANSGGDNG